MGLSVSETCLVRQRFPLVGRLGLHELEEELLVVVPALAFVLAAAGALARLLSRERIRAGTRLVVQVAARVLTAVAVALVCTRPALEPVDTMSVWLVQLNWLISMIPFHDHQKTHLYFLTLLCIQSW
jgi:hypothetical protein